MSLVDDCWAKTSTWASARSRSIGDFEQARSELLAVFEDYARLKAMEPAMNQVIDRVEASTTSATAVDREDRRVAIVEAARKLAEAAK